MTDPPTTFPYYHPDEETVLGQTARLPDYATFGGQGVTIAFLDSVRGEADAEAWHMATGVREHDGRVWVGSLHEAAVAVIDT